MKIGRTIRRLRKARNLTLVQLSKLSGVQSATISRIENGKQEGTLSAHAKISKVFGMKLSELFSEVEIEDLE